MSTYDSAKAQFADWGIDTDAAIHRLKDIPISMHCWQGDDVVGFEKKTGNSGGG
ncbi:L-rhamnose isomerase, partial [Primorskyibacter sedentarius]|uniref:L-rhamnose isomerase n=1 Tax=Primorskyibacter sedentarius TaxID=745311 RepID=UPI003EB71A04